MLLFKIYRKISVAKDFEPIPLIVAPNAPAKLTVEGNSLNWEPVENSSGYVIYANGSAIGYNKVALFVDTLTYDTPPVYTVRTVGPHGNLSPINGESEDFTIESINDAVNKPIVISGIGNELLQNDYVPKVENGTVWFDEPVSCKVFNLLGQQIIDEKNISKFDLRRIQTGVHVFIISNEKHEYHSFKIANLQ